MKYLALSLNGTPIEAPPGIPTGEQYTIGNIATFFIQLALVAGIFLSLFYLLYGGFYWLQASGSKEKWDKARRTVIYSLLGLLVMSLALVFVNLVAGAFGIKTVVNP